MAVDLAFRRRQRLRSLARRRTTVEKTRSSRSEELSPIQQSQKRSWQRAGRILVINGAASLAEKVITQLKNRTSGCEPYFVPSIAAAKLMIQRYKFDLIIGNALLPDGPITRLEEPLGKLILPPPVIVVDSLSEASELTLDDGYRFARFHHVRLSASNSYLDFVDDVSTSPHGDYIDSVFREVTADLRDRLNNPLQEIVAMVYVAKNARSEGELVESALLAIQQAALQMHDTVQELAGEYRLCL